MYPPLVVSWWSPVISDLPEPLLVCYNTITGQKESGSPLGGSDLVQSGKFTGAILATIEPLKLSDAVEVASGQGLAK